MRAREVLAAVRRSGGATVAVSEVEIERALFELGRIGLYVGADLSPRRRRVHKTHGTWGIIQPDETTVVVLTGSGLKTTRRIGELMDGGRDI